MENVLIILFLLLSVCLFIFLYRSAKKTYRDAKEHSLEDLERWKEEKLQEYLSKKRQEEESKNTDYLRTIRLKSRESGNDESKE